MPHRIRLKKPWTRRDDRGDAIQGVDIPDSRDDLDSVENLDSLDDGRGEVHRCVTYCRRFNRPTGIEPGDRLELEIGEVGGRLVEVRLNQMPLKMSVPTLQEPSVDAHHQRADITDRAADHNELEIEIHASDRKPRLIGPVNLWII